MGLVIDFGDGQMQSYWVPLIVSALSVGLLRFLLGPWLGVLLGSLGIAFGFLAGFLLAHGFPGWPPADALDMLPYIILAGMALGALLDEANNPESLIRPLYIGAPMVIVFWLGVAFYGGFHDISGTVPYALLMIAGIIALQRMHEDRDHGIASPVALLAALAGLAVIGIVSGTSLARDAIAMAMAIIGFLAWNWPRCRFPWGTAGSVSMGGAYLTLAALIYLQNPGTAIPLLLSFAVFFVHPLTEHFFMPEPRMSPVIQALVSVVAVTLAGGGAYYLG